MGYLFTTLEKTEDQGAKLGVFSTGPSYPNYVANFMSEIIEL